MAVAGCTRRACLLWLGAAALGRPSLASGSPLPVVDLAVGAADTLYDLPIKLAAALGFFAAAGVEVHLWEYPGGMAALEAVREGHADVGAGPFDALVLANARGASLQSFFVYGRTPQLVLAASSRTLPPQPTIQHLVGKLVGVTSFGSASHRFLRLVLLDAGVPESAVRVIPVGAEARAAEALRAGSIDGFCGLDPWMTRLERSGDVRVLADSRSVRSSDALFQGAMPGGCLFAPYARSKAGDPGIERVAQAVFQALKWLRTAELSDWNALASKAAWARDVGTTSAAVAVSLQGYTADGGLPEGGARTAWRTLVRLYPELSGVPLSLSRLHTEHYALLARARLRL
ncbi:NitT/TauT family transport system substrate-binding protein [Tibeticola sediminis]|uniref:NitT/TauT family transport system substrate-binding protein n=1 Tax=Tibeticola sediminis TaxID=1917811 RepID=A0A3N4UPV9_9BURK|nr:NitT/TauT family transport system substrate-binding protein [Tibeticola sediminis]